MTINNVRIALNQRYEELADRYKKLCIADFSRSSNSQAVTRHGIKRDICIIDLILELTDLLDKLGYGLHELDRDDSMLAVRYLAKRPVMEIEELSL